MLEAALGFLVVILLILVRIPVALAMLITGFLGFALLGDLNIDNFFDAYTWKAPISLVATNLLNTIQNYELSIIPLFILMGNIVAASSISKELYQASYSLVGHFKGGLSMATIIASGGFSAISGSSLATAATMGKIALPEMKHYKYSMELASASVAAGGTLGILIPPSVVLVIYGIITQQSIRELFMAGLIPGILGVLFYMLAVAFVVWRDPEKGPSGQRATPKQRIAAFKKTWKLGCLIILVMGGIYLGIFTPTEAAGIGAFGALFIALFEGKIKKFSTLWGILKDTVVVSTSLFSILIAATVFSDFVARTGMNDSLAALITSLNIPAMLVIMMILLCYLILGMVFESLSMMLLTLPVFFPIVAHLGFDLVWFGIIVVVAIEISLITPPIGLNVFVLNSTFPEIKSGTIFRGITPFWFLDIVRLLILTLIPGLSLLLPRLIYH